ncbi:hypothetical protein PMAYCL1PPCAC_26535, partial [Pristionchus mayeri]
SSSIEDCLCRGDIPTATCHLKSPAEEAEGVHCIRSVHGTYLRYTDPRHYDTSVDMARECVDSCSKWVMRSTVGLVAIEPQCERGFLLHAHDLGNVSVEYRSADAFFAWSLFKNNDESFSFNSNDRLLRAGKDGRSRSKLRKSARVERRDGRWRNIDSLERKTKH